MSQNETQCIQNILHPLFWLRIAGGFFDLSLNIILGLYKFWPGGTTYMFIWMQFYTWGVPSNSLRSLLQSMPGMLTLFMAITGGVNYDDALRPLREVSTLAIFLVILYVALTVLVVLNAAQKHPSARTVAPPGGPLVNFLSSTRASGGRKFQN